MQKLLVIDDEPSVLYSFKKRFEDEELSVLTAQTASDGLRQVAEEHPAVVILDLRLPDLPGLDAYAQIRQIDPLLPVVIITAYSTTDTAIEATKQGAFEYLLKPVDFHHLRDVLDRALKTSRARYVPALFDAEQTSATEMDRIIGRSRPMQELYKAIGRVAPQNVTVLLLGESGTGKELVARSIYHHSPRSRGPFLAVNCAALSESLLESELFGHEQGAFTGADRRRIGKFEQVQGGTIFLDEIGDMSRATQAKVLRLLQEGEFERVGGHTTIKADVRVIAATNRHLERMVEEGTFRQDLFYRLNGLTILIPPLRDRKADVPLLVDHFVQKFSQQFGRRVSQIAPEALAILESHDWPGNVRELQNVIKYAVIHVHGECITLEALPKSLVQPSVDDAAPDPETLNLASYVRGLLQAGQTDLYHLVAAEVDRILLREVLEHVGGNQVQASNLLGISRSTLRSKLGIGRSNPLLRDPGDGI